MLATPPPFPGRPASPRVEPRAVHSDGRSSFLKRFPLPLTAFHSQCHCLFPHLLLGFYIVTAFSFETLYLNKVFCKGNTVAKLCSAGGHSLYQELLRASHASRPFPPWCLSLGGVRVCLGGSVHGGVPGFRALSVRFK